MATLILVLGISGSGASTDLPPMPVAKSVSVGELDSTRQSPGPQPLRRNANIHAWRMQYADAFSLLGAAAGRLATAINHGDFNGIHTVCRDIAPVNQRIRNALPSPDRDLTSALRQMTDQLSNATKRCTSLGFTSNTGEFIQFGNAVKSASSSFEAARAIMRSAEPR